MSFHDRPVFPRGFRCASRNCGLKPSGRDLALFASAVDAEAAAVFTRNHFPGAPVMLGRETIRGGRLRGVVVNSKVSNVATGAAGMDAARRMAAAAAAELGTSTDRILVSSTGVIGVPLPIERIERGLVGMRDELGDDPLIGAEGIMTTDTYPKALSAPVEGSDATITWVAKGSGMIEPNMATMLAYIFTDAALDSRTLDRLLHKVVDRSFNMLSVDSDTSTSDTCAILANGQAGAVDESRFLATLSAGCLRMTELLARDGEGATRLLRVVVRGAASDDEARRIAKSIVNSPLIKTMVHGADPNIGRILMAVGKCVDCTVRPESTDASVNGHPVVRGGARLPFDEQAVRAALAVDTVELDVSLGVGAADAVAFGCDLTKGYIDENAAYYSTEPPEPAPEPQSLTALRARVDALDHEMLSVLERRMRLVTEIAAWKRTHGLRIRDAVREQQVLDDRAAVAEELSLPRDAVESLFRVLMRASRDRQAALGAELPRDMPVYRVAVIGAAGGMGRLLVRLFAEWGQTVLEVDRDTRLRAEEAAASADVTVVSVPIGDTEAVIRAVGAHVPERGLLMDVTSLKEAPVAAMLASTRASVVGTHPMFGPDVHSLQGQRVVLCRARGETWAEWVARLFAARGMTVIESTPDDHDRAMAVVQVLTHYQTQVLGLTLARAGTPVEETRRFSSPAYLLELVVTARHFAQSAELYGPIEMRNRRTAEITSAFREAAGEVAGILERGDQEAFDTLFAEVRRYFHGFTEEALEQSTHLIDRLVERA